MKKFVLLTLLFIPHRLVQGSIYLGREYNYYTSYQLQNEFEDIERKLSDIESSLPASDIERRLSDIERRLSDIERRLETLERKSRYGY